MLLLKIIVTAVAGFLVLLGWLKKEEKYRKIGLPLAFLLLFGSIVLTIAEDLTKSKLERERKADLIYIQKLNSPVHRLGFDFTLVPIDTSKTPKLQMLIRMDVDVTEYGQSVHFAGVIDLCFAKDSGWTICYNEFPGKEDIYLEFDSSKTHLSFWLNDFGIPWRGNTAWRPNDIADLAKLKMQLVIQPDNTPTHYAVLPKRWCPIKQVRVYVNNINEENLLLSTSSNESKYPAYVIFSPDFDIPFYDSHAMSFRINPLWMRESILESLN